MSRIRKALTLMPEATETKDMRPHFEDIQAHYDLSDDFFGLFQDPTRKYSCAYFTGPTVTLSEAQIANVDQHLDALDLKPGMTLLEVGCGWGLTLQRAMEKYDVNVIGLTLSKNQKAYCDQLLAKVDSERTFDVRLEGWEQFHSPVDRIVSIEAFEHFGFERYDDYFKTCFEILPDDGRMTIQSSVGYHPYDLQARGKKLTFELARFAKFIGEVIFPGGRIPTTQMMIEHGEKAGFTVPEPLSLRNHYIKTLGIWAARLEQHKDEAIAAAGEESYNNYMRYLTGCQYYFVDEALDVSLVTYLKQGAAA
ncbi:SAM-dependent methyltransferase [Mycobacterium sp. WY10]|nr:SAM-dependent methyltransferase [Mycobacterium sp. WY10]